MASDVRSLSCPSELDSLYSFTSVVLPRRASVRHSAACWLLPLGVSAWIRLSFCVWPSASAVRSGGGGGAAASRNWDPCTSPPSTSHAAPSHSHSDNCATDHCASLPPASQSQILNPTHSPATPLPSQASLCSTKRARACDNMGLRTTPCPAPPSPRPGRNTRSVAVGRLWEPVPFRLWRHRHDSTGLDWNLFRFLFSGIKNLGLFQWCCSNLNASLLLNCHH